MLGCVCVTKYCIWYTFSWSLVGVYLCISSCKLCMLLVLCRFPSFPPIDVSIPDLPALNVSLPDFGEHNMSSHLLHSKLKSNMTDYAYLPGIA